MEGQNHTPMTTFPPLAIVSGIFTVVLGVPFGLYALLTRVQRRTTREIRSAAAARGWRYRRQRWRGNPTAFRIDGQSHGGLAWILTAGDSSGYDRGWTGRIAMRFPTLGGEVDFGVFPRTLPLDQAIPMGTDARLAAFSNTAASAAGLSRDAREVPSGLPAFDAAYQVLGAARQITKPPVDPDLAARILHWPAGAVAAHSVLAWRDPFALEFQVRLPGPPNWATVAYTVTLGEDLSARLPSPVAMATPPKFVDRMIARLMR